MMLKTFIFLLIISSVGACPLAVVATPPNASIANLGFALTQTETGCKVDEDCTFVPADCCGCNQGGSQTAVNKEFEQIVRERIASSCGEIMCVQMMSNDPTCKADAPICARGVCAVSE